MNTNNQKAIVFLLSFIFVLSTFSGAVSATIGGTNSGSDVFAFINDTSLNYTTFHNNSTYIHSEKFTKKTLPDNLASEPTDQQFKKQKEGLENLRTISTKGLPPKRPGELVAINIERMHSMINTAKTKITRISSSFYKKILK
nr:hypothetical protein [uncultured Methanobacterium sp.]